MTAVTPSSPGDAPVPRGRVDVRELGKPFEVSAPRVSAGLSVAVADREDMRCRVPGCPEPHARAAVPDRTVAGDALLGGAAIAAAFRSELADQGLARAAWNAASRLALVGWRFVRQVSGDDAYERYADHMQRAHPGVPGMTRGHYYRFRTEQKWNRITRCC
jgi:uncharacterized short protein YbdD (DUF466 family)